MSEEPAAPRGGARRGELLLVALAVVVFARSLGGEFLDFDDNLYVTANPRVQAFSLTGLLHLWSPADAWAGRFLEYLPLRDTFYWLLWGLFGPAAWAFHATNIALHALCTVLARRVFAQLGVAEWATFAGALLFAVHPVHVESIAWIAGLKDPLFTSFVLVALLLHLRRAGPTGDPRTAGVFALALFCKGIALAFAPIAVLADLLVPPARSLVAVARRAWPIVLLAGLATLHFVYVARQSDVISARAGRTFMSDTLTSAWSALVFVSKMLAPVGLNARYLIEPIHSPLDVRFLSGALVVVALTSVAVVLWRRGVWQPLFAWGFYIAGLLPVLAPLPRPIEVADRLQYLSSVGACFLFAWVLERAAERAGRAPVVGIAGGLVAGAAVLTFLRIPVFHDDLALWRDVADQPGAMDRPFILNNLGSAHSAAGDHEEAARLYQRAVDVARPDDETAGPAHGNLALHHLKRDDLARAREHADRAAELQPRSASVHRVRLMIAQRQQDWTAATESARAMVAAEPRVPGHRMQLGAVRLLSGDDGGLGDLAAAVQEAPSLCGPIGALARDLDKRAHPRAADVRALCP